MNANRGAYEILRGKTGREEKSITGCIRNGVTVWQVMEIVLYELADTGAKKVYDPATGFRLLEP
ncbi:MAG: hypothetical protein R6V54_05930 [Desulfobacteraceae bacterium]